MTILKNTNPIESEKFRQSINLRRGVAVDIRGNEIQDRVNHLLDIGFSLEFTRKLLDRKSTGIHKELVDEKLDKLRLLGFQNPVRLIESDPKILSYDLENKIKPNLDGLRLLGFDNPVRLIESRPEILHYNLENNIGLKIKIVDFFIKDKESGRNLIYEAPEILGAKRDKTWIILRGLWELGMLQLEIIKRYKPINIQELESFILTVRELKINHDFMSLGISDKIRILLGNMGIYKKKGTKQERIAKIFMVTDKIGQRYARGYSKK